MIIRTQMYNVEEAKDLIRQALKLPKEVPVRFDLKRSIGKEDRILRYELHHVVVGEKNE